MIKPNSIYCGNCLDVMKQIESGSVHCCITSPPYWGLRDYGTARWKGGLEDCDHVCQYNDPTEQACSGGITNKTPHLKNNQTASQCGRKQYTGTCRKCGAIRIDSQLGLESTPEEYVANMIAVFREVRRVLRDDGTLWLNLGDSYANNGVYIGDYKASHPDHKDFHTVNAERYPQKQKGFRGGEYNIKAKDLVGIPWAVAFALRADGWWLRQDIIWHKPNPMPESVTDRCTKAHEYVFLMTKSARYYYDNEAVREPNANHWIKWGGVNHKGKSGATLAKEIKGAHGKSSVLTRPMTKEEQQAYSENGRNKRSVWTVTTKPFSEAHFATFPEKLIEPMVLAGCPRDGIILDPFMGAGTTAVVAVKNGRNYVGCELNPEYIAIAELRVRSAVEQITLL